MSVRIQKISYFVILVLVVCLLSAVIIGCNNQEKPDTTGSNNGSGPAQITRPGETEGIVISPTDDPENPGAIEIVLPNQDDGEEGDSNVGGNTGSQGGGDASEPTQGSSDPTEATQGGTEVTEPSQGGDDNTEPSQSTDPATEPTQGNDGTDDGSTSATDPDNEEPDLVVDFDDIFNQNDD